MVSFWVILQHMRFGKHRDTNEWTRDEPINVWLSKHSQNISWETNPARCDWPNIVMKKPIGRDDTVRHDDNDVTWSQDTLCPRKSKNLYKYWTVLLNEGMHWSLSYLLDILSAQFSLRDQLHFIFCWHLILRSFPLRRLMVESIVQWAGRSLIVKEDGDRPIISQLSGLTITFSLLWPMKVVNLVQR